MHIAVCDDNVMDRKQMERLLKREADARTTATTNFFADSYGNAPALLNNPMQYDLFYVDICKTEGVTGHDVVKGLLDKGVKSPIVLCCSDIDYRTESYPENVFFLDKPIKAAELSASIDQALSMKSQEVPVIELRDDKETIYVTEPEILYASESGSYVVVVLSDKREVRILTNIWNFYSQVEKYPSFAFATNKIVLNARNIVHMSGRKALMPDGNAIKISKDCMHDAEEAYLKCQYHYI